MSCSSVLRVVSLVALGAMLAACTSAPTAHRPPAAGATPAGPSPAETIIVPSGEPNDLSNALRSTLAQRGWTLIGYSDDMTRGADDYAAMAARARYRLTLQSRDIGPCADGGTSYRYRLALIENASGTVPITLSGADCMSTVVRAFAADLDEDGLQPEKSAGR